MMREWATVASWENGIATLHTEAKTSCNSCTARKGCGSHLLNKLGPADAEVMQIASKQPLQPGQRIELGIRESSLLGSALLVYMTPLLGLFMLAGLFQMLFHSDLASASGALLGGVGGFILSKGISALIGDKEAFQPVILSIALPPDTLRFENVKSE
ncbi:MULTISPECIES: SoxR-reducing system protein RseC [Tatumella]|uniref:SoxR-reducing system protein RseC n=1 Tax=Tatumella punctata TaxID=399969 RepID=A0ABW1VT22_9GAMM|nr:MULTISPECIES: SoxR-reducing system protein RseC [unclassified Tatumella]MBS0856975.1 SoxR-reducing system protein RseC [Tatumella sp. JGM16]MBS0878195.1 SoxR-reducing system protein RseC [Tatumella sp. JGM82]MBS0891717.1 SoxR-reducing system protein RseC [Tatumella sp. JGM94]MBS0893925.1 SoxR-reducing system protein RseC [Tatumella sp. JGM130]MBS0902943.1 SoxR-reducing system protein RseC [Tatumella sp. JGM100]